MSNSDAWAKAEQPVLSHVEPAEANGPTQDREEQMRAVARIVEILREGGYHCEVIEDTLTG